MSEETQEAQKSSETLNSWICLVLGGCGNILLLWLIKNKSNTEMKDYKRMLALLSSIQLAYLCICVVVQPQLLNNGNFYGNVMGGPFAKVPQPWNHWIYNTWVFTSFLTLNTDPIIFFYRYLIFCWGIKLSVRTFYLMLLWPVTISFGAVLICSWQFWQEPLSDIRLAKAAIFPNKNSSDVVGVFGKRDTIYSQYTNVYFLAMLFFDFGTDILFSFLIWRHISKVFKLPIHKNKKAANQQVMGALMFEAIAPLFLALLPIATSAILTLLNISIDFLGLGTILNWSPVFNPLITIVVVTPYRKFFISLIKKRMCGEVNTVNVSTRVTAPSSRHSNCRAACPVHCIQNQK